MKIKIKTKSRKSLKEIDFPKLMIHRSHKIIVLFENEKSGIVLNISDNSNSLTLFKLYNDLDFTFFKDYSGSITIQND